MKLPQNVREALERVLDYIKPDQAEYDDWYFVTREDKRAGHPYDDYRMLRNWLDDGAVTLNTQMLDALKDAETEIENMLEDFADEPEDDVSAHRTLATIRAAIAIAEPD
jgi:hypothetical protein